MVDSFVVEPQNTAPIKTESVFHSAAELAQALGDHVCSGISAVMDGRDDGGLNEDAETFVKLAVMAISDLEQADRFFDRMMAQPELTQKDLRAWKEIHASAHRAQVKIEARTTEEIQKIASRIDTLPAFSGTWLKHFDLHHDVFDLNHDVETEEGLMDMGEALWKMSNVNHQRACERLIAFHALCWLKNTLHPEPSRNANSEAARRQARLLDTLHHARLVARARMDKIGLALGGEALEACQARARADLARHSSVEYLSSDGRLPSRWPTRLEEAIRQTLSAGEPTESAAQPRSQRNRQKV